jgi:hypothetical protein
VTRKPKSKPPSEVEVGRPLVESLRARGWTVYQEVESRLGPIADVVAVRGPVLWVIEVKVRYSFAVLEQAHAWKGHANFRSVAVPDRPDRFQLEVAQALGLGVLEVMVAAPSWVDDPVIERARPEFSRSRSTMLSAKLRPEQQTYAEAGGNGRWTPFKATCEQIRWALGRKGPMTIRELVVELHGLHHYASEASARTSLFGVIQRGLVDGVELATEVRGQNAIVRLRVGPP